MSADDKTTPALGYLTMRVAHGDFCAIVELADCVRSTTLGRMIGLVNPCLAKFGFVDQPVKTTRSRDRPSWPPNLIKEF
jgi:hypothetical protein